MWQAKKAQLAKKARKAIQKHQTKMLKAKRLLMYVASYGFALNYAMYVLADKRFNILTLFGWGFVFYFLRVELIGMIKEAKVRKLTISDFGGIGNGINLPIIRARRRNTSR